LGVTGSKSCPLNYFESWVATRRKFACRPPRLLRQGVGKKRPALPQITDGNGTLVLDNRRVFVETPRLITDDELADVLAAFVAEVRARARAGSASGRAIPARAQECGPQVAVRCNFDRRTMQWLEQAYAAGRTGKELQKNCEDDETVRR
jgi:hypothetical protein